MFFLEYVKKNELHKKVIDTIGKYKVCLVDGEYVRKINITDHEFGDSAIHNDYPSLIPKNEIWIDSITRPEEIFFISHQAIAEYELISKGVKGAYKKSLKIERKLREIMDGIARHPKTYSKKPPAKIYTSKYGIVDGDITIWLVDGEFVRDYYKTDYLEGGNPEAYYWVPKKEIWIEDTVRPSEIPLIILHEFTEMCLMKHKELSYDKAHTIASKVEFAHEGKFAKVDALLLDCTKALNWAKKYLKSSSDS